MLTKESLQKFKEYLENTPPEKALEEIKSFDVGGKGIKMIDFINLLYLKEDDNTYHTRFEYDQNGDLFAAQTYVYPSLKGKTCKTCVNRQSWECGNRIIQYCGVIKSNRTDNGLKKIKCKTPACDLYNEKKQENDNERRNTNFKSAS